MKFRIISQCLQDATGIRNSHDVDFLLEQDKWDDYGFHTLYHVHASAKLTGNVPEYLGSINIMKKGQKKEEFYLVFKEMQGDFTRLTENFCSISMSVELYRGLARTLKKAEERKLFVESLRMIFSEKSLIYPDFKDEECFKESLLRNASMDAYGLKFGKEIMLGETSDYDLATIPLTYTLPGNQGKVSFDFSCGNPELEEKMEIPSRLLACIGNNGSGKSTILYRLARILFATPSSRSAYAAELGTIQPSDAGFRRLFVISYSAFDNFIMPGIGKDDFRLILDGIKNNNGRFVFCGIRDIETEYSEQIEQSKAAEEDEEGESSRDIDWSKIIDKDHRDFHRLKTIDSLANEFESSYNRISQDDEKQGIWNRLMDECSRANGFMEEMKMNHLTFFIGNENARADNFKTLSTGIKFLLHSLASVLDRIEENSLIIFDEPENHIQPPLLCKFLYSLRIIARKYKSLILVATHSPVILQETLSRNVLVVSRNGDTWNFRNPSVETYGENIGNITDEVFSLNTSVTNYQNTAERLFMQFPPSKAETSDPLSYLDYIREKTDLDPGNEIKAYLISRYIEPSN